MNKRNIFTLTPIATAIMLLPFTLMENVRIHTSIAISLLTLFVVLISIKPWMHDVFGKAGQSLTPPITTCLIIPIWCMNVTRQVEMISPDKWDALIGSCIIISIPVIAAFVVNEKLKDREPQTH